jgi:hypothetical protein
MSLSGLAKAFDTIVVLRDAARRFKASSATPQPSDTSLATAPTPSTGLIEARLTSVVVAALKEAFDRDHARLELERAQLDEQRRRADEALRAELRRQAADREVGRLRLIAGTALIGWIAAVAFVLIRLDTASAISRVVSGVAWFQLLAALATAFMAQGRVSASVPAASAPIEAGRAGEVALWLLVGGLACAAVALLL